MDGGKFPGTGKDITSEFIDEFGHLAVDIPRQKTKHVKKTKPEGVYTTKLIKGFEQASNAASDKIPDPVGSYKTTPRPFDCFATLEGRSVVYECKYFKGYQAVGLRHLREKQKLRLKAHYNAGALACVVAFFKVAHRVRMVVIPFNQLAQTGTIRKRDIESLPYDVVTNGVFPITQFKGLLGV